MWGSHVSMIEAHSHLPKLSFPGTVLVGAHVLFSPSLQCPHGSDVCKVGYVPVPCQLSLVLSGFSLRVNSIINMVIGEPNYKKS